MTAPAALLMAKIMMPETEVPESRPPAPEDEAVLQEVLDDRNVIDAAARGAAEGLRLALNVGAMLIAFVSLIALLNLILGSIGGLFGFEELSLQLVLGYIFAPVAFAILLGGVGGMAPSRRSQIAQFGIRALIAGTLANLLNAAIAGMLVG
jgi:CNT family concentrative nucleoside transporter